MEGLQKAFCAFSQNSKLASSALSSCFDKPSFGEGASSSIDHSQILISRPTRQVVSLWTCSKLCGVCFVAGVVVGFTLKRRVRRWASRLLKGLKDD